MTSKDERDLLGFNFQIRTLVASTQIPWLYIMSY